MAQLQDRERRLLLVFGAVLVGVVTWVLWGYVSEEMKRLKEEIARESEARATNLQMLSERDEWTPRRDWLETYQPRLQEGIDPMGNLENFAINSARSEGLEMTRPADPRGERQEPTHISYSLDLDVKGSWGAVVRWLASLQEQDRFVVLTQCEIMPLKKGDAEVIKCSTRIERWYGYEGAPVAMAPPPEEAGGVPAGAPPGTVADPAPGEGGEAVMPPGAGDADAEPEPAPRRIVLPPGSGPAGAGEEVEEEESPEEDAPAEN